MKRVQRSMVLAAAAMICLPIAITRCNVHGSSPDLGQYDHPAEAGEEASVMTEGDDGSSDDASDASETPAPDASSDSGDKDSSAKDGGNGGDAGDASEEPPGCSTPQGGAACTPHSVACSSSSCTTPGDVCCATSTTTSPPTGTCVTASTACLNSVVACEEAADCASGVCCQTPSALGPGAQTCMTSCPALSYQVCRSNTECPGDAGCVPQSCPYGVGMMYEIEQCGLQTGCTATN
jgi:hypothetical protein